MRSLPCFPGVFWSPFAATSAILSSLPVCTRASTHTRHPLADGGHHLDAASEERVRCELLSSALIRTALETLRELKICAYLSLFQEGV